MDGQPSAGKRALAKIIAGKSGTLDGVWKDAGELKFARMCERKFGHTAFSPVRPADDAHARMGCRGN